MSPKVQAFAWLRPQRERACQICALFLCFALPLWVLRLARPATGTLLWQPLRGYPGDSTVQQVLIGQGDGLPVYYAVGARGGIYVSVDDGQRWARAVQGLPKGPWGEVKIVDLALVPADPTVAYAAVASPGAVLRPMLYWTADLGATWKPRASLAQERLQALAFGPGGEVLYAVTNYAVLRGAEADESLTPQERFQRGLDNLRWVTLYVFEPADRSASLLVSEGAVLSWPGAVRGPVYTLYLGTRRGLHILMDGREAQPVVVPAGGDAETRYVRQEAEIRALARAAQDTARLYVATERGIFATSDGGLHWQALAHPFRGEDVRALLTDPQQKDTLYVGLAGQGVFLSQDAGATWRPLGQGLERVSVLSLALGPGMPRVLLAGTTAGLWRLELPDAGMPPPASHG